MIERWLEAYAKWPAAQQVTFSALALVAVLVLFVLVGVWLTGIAKTFVTLFRGYPADDRPTWADIKEFNAYLEKFRATKHRTALPEGKSDGEQQK